MGKYADKAKQRATFRRYRERHKERLCSKVRNYLRTPKGRYSVLLSTARARMVPVDLSFDEHQAFLLGPCFYCGGPLSPTGTGLDRKTSCKGYVLGNVVPCCGKCNEAKNDLTQEEFATWVVKVYERFAREKVEA